MGIFRHTTALLLAILIANPLCCCFAQAGVVQEKPAHSCCAQSAPSEDQAPLDPLCSGCQAKAPRVADSGKTLLLNVELLELPTMTMEGCELCVHPRELSLAAIALVPPAPSPRLVLVLQQRFLI